MRGILHSSCSLPGPCKHCRTNNYQVARWPRDAGATRKPREALPSFQSHREE